MRLLHLVVPIGLLLMQGLAVAADKAAPKPAAAAADGKAKAASGDTVSISTALLSKNGKVIRVVFSQTLAATGPQSKLGGVQLQGTPPEVAVSSSAPIALEPNALLINLSAEISSVTGVKVCFSKVDWTDTNAKAQETTDVCSQISQDFESAKAAALKELTGVPKSSTEKNVFASGFVATGSGTAQGGGNISLNPDLGIRGMTAFVNIDKATVPKGDPKSFNGGIGYQSVLPWWRGDVFAMATANDEETLADALRRQQSRIFAGAVLDVKAKLEGDPGSFKVTNFVGEADLSFRTRTKRLGASKGYWRGFLIPAGFEAGQNLNAGDIVQPTSSSSTSSAQSPTTSSINSVNHIARYLAGVDFSTFYEDWNGTLPFKRVELEANALARYLFLNEAMYNSSSQLFNTVADGVRGYVGVDLKLYVGQNSSARYGIKMTYALGSLPPTFARVKTFQIGLLYETRDDTTKAK
jgi:hypothetical protein